MASGCQHLRMAPKRQARVVATGIVFEQPADPASAYLDALGVLTEEARAALAQASQGHVVLLISAAFADVDPQDGSGVRRWRLAPQGPHQISTAGSATAALLSLVEHDSEDLLAALRMQGLAISRFDFYAAPHRFEVDEGVRRLLTLD